ncbi:MAG: putative DNA binding domain-containing protein [Candidatus Thermoplasmatota archaeon]|nr:putative DNA binding domain-containing protein [Candidatus Thermoplasmatota archaeon]
MNKEELNFLISQGESYNLEFKESLSGSLDKDICAFANANGGKVLLGVSDDGKIKGIKITNRLKSQISHIARNLLFGLLQRMNLVEKVGTGIKRMQEAMKNYKLKIPKIEANRDWFTITFKRLKESYEERLYGKIKEGLVENQRKILSLIRENSHISKKEMAESIGISTTAIDKNITSLKKKGLLKRVGPDRGGYWKVLEKTKEALKLAEEKR